MTRSPDDTEHLVRRARDGDKTAKAALLVRHEKRLAAALDMRWGADLNANPSRTRSVLQDSLIDAYCELDRYLERPRRPFMEWLLGIARKRLETDTAARVSNAVSHSTSSRIISASWLARRLARGRFAGDGYRDDRARAARLDTALARLDPEHRQLIVLRHVEHCSMEDIAEKLRRDSAAVKIAYLRALDQLRAALEES